jgi:AcrR family transcriptional regulator
MAKPVLHSDTRQQLLRAALKHFANSGYAATSVRHIVDDARLSKPALYYHFKDKAGLFQALVHQAHDERYRVLCGAVRPDEPLPAQLENLLRALFAFFRANRELIRIAFATMFAAPGELPAGLDFEEKCRRNFEFVHALFQRAQKNGELNARFDCEAMAFGFYGIANMYLVGHLVREDCQPDQLTAKRIVELFLSGAGPRPGASISEPKLKGKK